ncbi:hypothetical protein PT974_11968 [Cladobotryum mycophilum]|uniref:DASH complex subunit DUO1 n=1 Tax=Cladobotryum mycophilum TaxID=491253 RepID=A0ABR0S6Q0_9HYPO
MADDTMHDDSDLWTSPVRNAPSEPQPRTPRTPKTPRTPGGQDGSGPVDREAILRRELEGVRNINEVVEGIIGTLQRTGGNMEAVSKTVANASTLLNTWTRILSQTEHNQRLLLNPNFKGASEDLAEIEGEELRRQQALKRRAVEEEQRREDARRRREEDEQKRSLTTAAPARGSRGSVGVRGARGRTRPASRVASGSSSSRLTETTTNTGASSSRGGSGIGRGYGTTRGRYRAAK